MDHKTTRTANGKITVDTFDHDDSSAVWISMHASGLDLSQETRTHKRSDGSRYKVKEIEAYDSEGNQVKLKIFYDA